MPSVKLCIESAIKLSHPLALRFACIAAKRLRLVLVAGDAATAEEALVGGEGVALVLLDEAEEDFVLEDLRTAVGLAAAVAVVLAEPCVSSLDTVSSSQAASWL